MSWRPDDWKIPDEVWAYNQETAHEAGADAMLEALKNRGAWMTPQQMRLLAPDRKYPFGWLVFIPEETKGG